MANWPAVLDIVMPDGTCNAVAKAKKATMFSTYIAAMDAFCAFDDEKDFGKQADEAQRLANAYIDAYKDACGNSLSLYHHAMHTHMIDDMRRLGNQLKFSCQSVESSIAKMLRTKKRMATHKDYILDIVKRECARLEQRARGTLTPRLTFATRKLYGLRYRYSPEPKSGLLPSAIAKKVAKPTTDEMKAIKMKREKAAAALEKK